MVEQVLSDQDIDTRRSRGCLDGLQIEPMAVQPPSGVLKIGLEGEADVMSGRCS